jgi:hypothetical protein
MTSESETLARLLAYHDNIDVPQVVIEDDVRRGRSRVRRTRGLIAGGAVLAVATLLVTGSLLSGGDRVQQPQPIKPHPSPTGTPSPTATESVARGPGWPGAVRDGSAWPRVSPVRTDVGALLGYVDSAQAWIDPADDAEVGLVDLRYVVSMPRIRVKGPDVTGEWRLRLARKWPGRTEIGPADGVVEYGVVVDTDGDRVADCQIGINDSAPQTHRYGDYRVWVTNLHSGVTAEQVGGPYGVPIDFVLPDESGQFVGFFFLTRGQPCHFRRGLHYYVYASATDVDGHVTAWDFAPDAAWLEESTDQQL